MILVAVAICLGMTTNMMAEDAAAETDQAAVNATVDQSSQSFDTWAESVKNPTDWFSWGGDFRLRFVGLNNWRTLNKNAAGDQDVFSRFRFRVWGKVNAADICDINAKITYEGRYWWEPEAASGWNQRSTVWDNLNAVFKDVAGHPLKITIGRQNIIKGTGWLVLDGTPLDGSRTIFNDAITMDYQVDDATSLSAIYLQNHGLNEDGLLPAIDDKKDPLADEDERGVIMWMTKKVQDKAIDVYFIYEHDSALNPQRGSTSDNGEYYTLGGAVGGQISENLSYRAEAAYQWGHKQSMFDDDADVTTAAIAMPGQDISAAGLNTQLVYAFNNDAKSSLRFDYEMLTGDDPDTADTNEAFDPLWGRWPQWSELLIYNYATETRIAQVTNLHRLAARYVVHPIEGMQVSAGYHLLMAFDNSNKATDGFSDSGKIRGHLVNAVVRHKFNKHLSGHLVGEVFFPGDYYETAGNRSTDTSTFARGEIVLTF